MSIVTGTTHLVAAEFDRSMIPTVQFVVDVDSYGGVPELYVPTDMVGCYG